MESERRSPSAFGDAKVEASDRRIAEIVLAMNQVGNLSLDETIGKRFDRVEARLADIYALFRAQHQQGNAGDRLSQPEGECPEKGGADGV